MAFDGIKKNLTKLFRSAGLPAIGDSFVPAPTAPAADRDLGPGLSASAGGYYGSYAGGGDGSKWQYGLSSSGSTPVLDHTRLRANARSAYHDSMPARAIVERFADTVPGIGLRLDPQPKAATLGITPEAAETWALKVAEAFDAWMGSKAFSLAEDETGYQSQRFATISQQRDGEYFIRLHYSKDARLLSPLQIQFLDPVQIQGYPMTDTYGLPMPDHGIVYDSHGRERAYNVMVYNETKRTYDVVKIPRFGGRAGFPLMLHGWQKEYAAQKRGYPRIAHAIQEFEQFTSFESGHIQKAINDAAILLSVKPSQENPASNPFQDVINGPAGNFQAPNSPDVTAETGGTEVVNYSEMNEVALTPESVGVFNLQAGESLDPFNGSTPADNYASFVDAFVKSLSASMSMPSEMLWMQFGQSFSASRATLVLFWQVVEIWRQELISDYLAPIYEIWLSHEIAAGRLSAPGWTDPRLRAAWLGANWIGFPLPNIDPMKAAKADELYINMGATTLDRVASEYNGSSGRANRAKLAREFEELPKSPFLKTAPDKEGLEEGAEGGKDKKAKPRGRPLGS